ncbi:MAG TPA: restriction endonuclease [Anaerolineaceae bacterium]|nr:restriction endonuclease [Anaerolineaceae bacterium]
MAKIRDAKGRRKNQSPSGYSRLFGNVALGNLLSKVHAAVISSGNELERLILERCQRINDFDNFVTDLDNRSPGIFVATKRQIKKSKKVETRFEPDLLAFDLVHRICYVIEVKDGDQFDTKKSEGERNTLHSFTSDVASVLPFSFKIYMCSFNAPSKEAIYHGLKHKFPLDELMTGKELCDLLGIDYDEILDIRKQDQEDNIDYFVESLKNIPEILNRWGHK